MPTNADYTRAYFQIIDELDGAVEDRRAAFEYMQNSTAIVHHQVVASSFVPRLFNRKSYEVMKRTAEMSHRVLCKVIERYRADEEYRKLFDFDERLVELILLPRDYDAVLPFARVDTFLNEEDYRIHFCEFNGDGSAGMNENREITNAVTNTEAFRVFAESHAVAGCDLFEPWVRTFLDIYDTYRFKVEHPRIAICDYLENGVVDEFHIFAEKFREAGVECVVADVRDLAFDGEVLTTPDGLPVHAIWRRSVTNDVLEFWDDSQALIDAVRARKVALIGAFSGHIVHDKQLFEVLFAPETQAFLTEEEIAFVEETVPMTAFLDESVVNLAQIRANKDEWIVKPTDHYGADNVYAGCEVSQQEWERVIDEFANGRAGYPFIVQRYIRPFKTDTLPPDAGILDAPDGAVASEPVPYNNLNGLYLYNGRFQGVFSRLGPHPTISKTNEGMTAATIWVDCEGVEGLGL
ncbi:circularly permuted type 2 ATP-grasp protein [Adlercreutzia muris]|uniref:circularly permuted type 2 ATP-grasp protein n=1 Tax=Adlercreutzia muris TaxID=1796610 RepID=UPI001F5A0450|nr:circularly permuted type 2 ATP-grasp protein [Adlercreutzia muris]MCU7585509.1 circularly permuted type 2 ATP-grasp protein [Adlercreutzia muris]